ncbi:delta-aminolevulinic acid dehydratase-like [Xenia sp. Carnegie-2017]|uniref:delta-aminolevulinic acid dehydratase-like n=1 Tax=Xenia sp. Carnegie-2017 TaxID=2897299 RepID=UPI001F04A937|nr:delta-aminolevulinic acid dehydratase-like [Xenia sp. Carnegie-2017]
MYGTAWYHLSPWGLWEGGSLHRMVHKFCYIISKCYYLLMADKLQSGFHHKLLREWQSMNTRIDRSCLIYPIFISDIENTLEPIKTLPGQFRIGTNKLKEFLQPLVQKGLCSVLLFGVPTKLVKDFRGSCATDPRNPVIVGIKTIRNVFPDLLVLCDVCLCAYADHGHCGILTDDGSLDSVKSNQRLAEISVEYAKAGCHVIAPSDMNDGRIREIKQQLTKNSFSATVSVMSYSAKFCSKFYGPFRDAAKSAPSFGDRSRYQLPPGSIGLAMRAVERDVNEGADMLMVKPGLPYLDVVCKTKIKYPNLPLAIYQVSGEYAMIYHGSMAGAFSLKDSVLETLQCMRRAGADLIITYFVPMLLEWMEADEK